MKVITIGKNEFKFKNNHHSQALERWNLKNFQNTQSGKLYINRVPCLLCETYDCLEYEFGHPKKILRTCPAWPCLDHLKELLKVKKFSFYVDAKSIYYTNTKKKEAEAQINAIYKTLEKAKEA